MMYSCRLCLSDVSMSETNPDMCRQDVRERTECASEAVYAFVYTCQRLSVHVPCLRDEAGHVQCLRDEAGHVQT